MSEPHEFPLEWHRVGYLRYDPEWQVCVKCRQRRHALWDRLNCRGEPKLIDLTDEKHRGVVQEAIDWLADRKASVYRGAHHVENLLGEIYRLRSIIATLNDHTDGCDQGGDCRCGRNQTLREVGGG
jgi:hypothetical protein